MAARNHTRLPALSPAQRRKEIIEILSTAVASMPLATAVPGKLRGFADTGMDGQGATDPAVVSTADLRPTAGSQIEAG